MLPNVSFPWAHRAEITSELVKIIVVLFPLPPLVDLVKEVWRIELLGVAPPGRRLREGVVALVDIARRGRELPVVRPRHPRVIIVPETVPRGRWWVVFPEKVLGNICERGFSSRNLSLSILLTW